MTLRLSSACSNQLSYTPAELSGAVVMLQLALSKIYKSFKAREKLVELRRFELPTYSLQSYRSTN